MTFNPEKNAPSKIDMARLKEGLSTNQMAKIKYECNLLGKDVQELLYLAPHLFTEGRTSAHTKVIEEVKVEEEVVEEEAAEIKETYGNVYSDYYEDNGYEMDGG